MLLKRRMFLASVWFTAVCPFCHMNAGAQSPSFSHPALQLYLPAEDIEMRTTPVPLPYSESSPGDGPRSSGIITGTILIFGGGALYLVGHLMAYRAYDDYRKSAFTVHTDQLRRKVIIFNGMRIGGGVVGGIGLIVLAASF